jgi:hypothetical protein
MHPKKVYELIECLLANPDSAPALYLWGPPGVGKSATPRGVTQKHHIGFCDNRAPLHDPTDYRGIPTVIGDNAVWLPPAELPTPNFCMRCQMVLHPRTMEITGTRVEQPDGKVNGVICKRCGSSDIVWKGILVLEELSSAPPMTQASCYQLTLDKMIGDYQLPRGWIILATSNRLEDRAVVHRTSTALLNRFIHVDYEICVDDWVEWALTDGHIDPDIVGFIKWRGKPLLFNFNPESSERAFATPRSWEFASKIMGLIKSKEILLETLTGCVGNAATMEFFAFLKIQKELPNLTDILSGKSRYVPDFNRIDLIYAIISALVANADPKQHFDNLIKYSFNLPREFSVLLITMMLSRDRAQLQLAPSFPKWAETQKNVILPRKDQRKDTRNVQRI